MDWSEVITAASFSGITDGITSALPVVIPVACVIIGIPVVWKLVKRFVKG